MKNGPIWAFTLQKTHKYTLFMLSMQGSGVCVCVCVCVYVCTFIKYTDYFTHCLFIQLTCINCSFLTDRCEDNKNHLPMWGIKVTEKIFMYPKGREDQTSQ